MTELTFVSAFLVGLLGGTHCAAMCGGIVSAISWRNAPASVRKPSNGLRAANHFAYSTGRIGSYAIAGTAAGWIGSGALLMDSLFPVQTALYLLASLLLLAQGLYLTGVWRGVVYLERGGARIWRHIQPWTRRLLPIDSAAKAFALGVLWGWLPCAMVYSVLAVALASGHPLSGGLTMLAFGLGTLPNLLAMGFAAGRLQPLLKHVRLRMVAGVLVMSFGASGLIHVLQAAVDPASAAESHNVGAAAPPGHGRAGH